jgi:GNAT superfamily N-acetyltransferase
MKRQNSGTAPQWVTPHNRPADVLSRAADLISSEGPGGFLRAAGRFLTTLGRRIYWSREVRFYHLSIEKASTVTVTAPCDNVSLHVIESSGQALDLAARGFENILEALPGSGRKLERGAVAACAFVGHELASIDWMALSDEARPAVDGTPYPPRLVDGEACTGGAYTMPRFRRRGIGEYRFSAEVQYLRARGCHVCYNTIAVWNIPSQRCVERYGATFDVVFQHRRLLGRDSFRTVRTGAPPPSPR